MFLNRIKKLSNVQSSFQLNFLEGGCRRLSDHKGANVVSVNIKRPIVAEAVVRDPMVIQINPKGVVPERLIKESPNKIVANRNNQSVCRLRMLESNAKQLVDAERQGKIDAQMAKIPDK